MKKTKFILWVGLSSIFLSAASLTTFATPITSATPETVASTFAKTTDNNFEYDLSDGKVILKKYIGKSSEIIIPNALSINNVDCPVVGASSSSETFFDAPGGVTKITLPETYGNSFEKKSTEKDAYEPISDGFKTKFDFKKFNYLSSINIPNSAESFHTLGGKDGEELGHLRSFDGVLYFWRDDGHITLEAFPNAKRIFTAPAELNSLDGKNFETATNLTDLYFPNRNLGIQFSNMELLRNHPQLTLHVEKNSNIEKLASDLGLKYDNITTPASSTTTTTVTTTATTTATTTVAPATTTRTTVATTTAGVTTASTATQITQSTVDTTPSYSTDPDGTQNSTTPVTPAPLPDNNNKPNNPVTGIKIVSVILLLITAVFLFMFKRRKQYKDEKKKVYVAK